MHERPLVENGREVDDGAQQRTPPKRVTASVPPYHRYSTYKYNSVEYHPNRICPSSFHKLNPPKYDKGAFWQLSTDRASPIFFCIGFNAGQDCRDNNSIRDWMRFVQIIDQMTHSKRRIIFDTSICWGQKLYYRLKLPAIWNHQMDIRP